MATLSEWLFGEPEFNRWFIKWEIGDYIKAAIGWLVMSLVGHLLTYFGILHANWGAFLWGATTACVLILVTGTVFAKVKTSKRMAEIHRQTQIDWYALSFQLPIEISGLWLKGLTFPDPFVAFKFMLTNATKKRIEITGLKGTININGPCSLKPRLFDHQRQTTIKWGPQIQPYEIMIEQPVMPENADLIKEALKRNDGSVHFGFSEVQFVGKVTLDNGDVVDLEKCYLDRTIKGTIGMGISVKGPMDATFDGLIGKSESCFVPLDAQGRPLPLRDGNSNSN